MEICQALQRLLLFLNFTKSFKYSFLMSQGIFEKQDLQEDNADRDVDVVSEAYKVNLQPEDVDCKIHQLSEVAAHVDSSVFFPTDWRKQLCLCLNCRVNVFISICTN